MFCKSTNQISFAKPQNECHSKPNNGHFECHEYKCNGTVGNYAVSQNFLAVYSAGKKLEAGKICVNQHNLFETLSKLVPIDSSQ
jgi:hypothetical protein